MLARNLELIGFLLVVDIAARHRSVAGAGLRHDG